MKLLVIDYLSPQGHSVFDSIQIHSLLSLGYELHIVGRKGQFPKFDQRGDISITYLPNILFRCFLPTCISERINGVLRLKWIKKHINISDYEAIVFLAYDILSLYFVKISKPTYVINHNNVDQFDSSIKLLLTRSLPSNYIHVALNEYMKDEMQRKLPLSKVFLVPHGYLQPPITMHRPLYIEDKARFVYCPINRNVDKAIVQDVLNSCVFNEYLRNNNILFFVKSQLCSSPSRNVRIIPYLNDLEYNYMLTKALAVFLPYGEEFRYRCSGILFECVARKTPIIATNRKALNIYKEKINIRFVTCSEDLIDALNFLQSNNENSYNVEQFNPICYWKSIFK